MKKVQIFIPVIITFVLSLPAFALQQTWSCEYYGKFNSIKSNEKGEFTWTVKWFRTESGWIIKGETEDQYGIADFNGECKNLKCEFIQKYKNREMKDKTYFYKGIYSDKAISKTKTVNSFTGTWGHSKENPSNGGIWEAKANCNLDN